MSKILIIALTRILQFSCFCPMQAARLNQVNKPTMWQEILPVIIETKGTNLSQGEPSWQPQKFYQDALYQFAKDKTKHQSTRPFGSPELIEAIAQFHKSEFPDINPEEQILVTGGASSAIHDTIMSFVQKEDEVIFFEPAYDFYRSGTLFAQGVPIGIPLILKSKQSKEELGQRCQGNYRAGQQDSWQIDFEALQQKLNQKTKMLILNSPHNPTGKIFSEEELARMAQILRKYPNVIVFEDSVYDGLAFDNKMGKTCPKMALEKGMKDRCITVFSASKLLAVPGARIGWAIACPFFINKLRTVHQYSMFCLYEPVQHAVAVSLQTISQPNNLYVEEYAKKLEKSRNLLLDGLIKSKFDIDLWIPQGGFFILADISRVQVMEKYRFGQDGTPRTKDFAFFCQLAYEQNVICIPCSHFYSKQDVHIGQKFIRFAFCKDEATILEGVKRMSKPE